MDFLLQSTHALLETLWGNAVANHKGHERDFLREIHGFWGIQRLAWAVNSDLWWNGQLASFSSIWVDHTPQCWYGSKGGNFAKPSCELADLLVVVWDDLDMKKGRALLLQGKMASVPDLLNAKGPSTRKELKLLEQSPPFLLSNQTSVQVGNTPSPYLSGKVKESTFHLKHLGTEAKNLKHCTFLQIKERTSQKKWPNGASSWQTHWPSAATTQPYSRCLAEMVVGTPNSLGEPFERGNNSTDWQRLVNLLIDTTVDVVRGTAKGKLQTLASFPYGGSTNNSLAFASALNCSLDRFIHFPRKMIELRKQIQELEVARGGDDIPGIPPNGVERTSEGSLPIGGIPILFIMPYTHNSD